MSKKSKLVAESPLVVPAVSEAALADVTLAETVTLDAVKAPGEPVEPVKTAEEKGETRTSFAASVGPILHLLFPPTVSGKALTAAREVLAVTEAAALSHRVTLEEGMRDSMGETFDHERFSREYPHYSSSKRKVEAVRMAREHVEALTITSAPDPMLLAEYLRLGEAYINEPQNRRRFAPKA